MTKLFASTHDGYFDLSIDDLRQGQVDPRSICKVMTAFGVVTFKNCRAGTYPSQLVNFADSFMRKRYESLRKAA